MQLEALNRSLKKTNISVVLFLAFIILSSVVSNPVRECGCVVETQFYLKGKLVKKIVEPYGYRLRQKEIRWKTLDGSFTSDSMDVQPKMKFLDTQPAIKFYK